VADRYPGGAPATLRADLAAGATIVGAVFGVLALLGGSVVAAFGVSTEAGLVVAGLSSAMIVACTLVGAEEMGAGFGAVFGVLIASVVAVAFVIAVGGAILFPLLVVPACATAVGAAIGAGRMYALADRR
jgi:hypothetical protein